MATPTYIALATFTATGGETGVTFGSIPGIYRDLVLTIDALGTSSVVDARMQFNGDSSSVYSQVLMYGNGSVTGSFAQTSLTSSPAGDIFDTHKTIYIHQFMDYSATDKHKTILSRRNASNDAVAAAAHRYGDTQAINQIAITIPTGSFVAGSTLNLFGIEA